jgi:hypothetical protein
MYKRRILEIRFEKIELASIGAGASTHVVAARLIWPRPAIAEKIAIKTLSFRSGSAAPQATAPWSGSILFKETVQGPCGLEIAVTRQVSDSQAARFAQSVYAAALNALGSQVGATVAAGSWVGLLQFALRHGAKAAGDPARNGPPALAVGSIDLPPSGLAAPGKTTQAVVPLVAPETLYEVRKRRRQGEMHLRRERVLAAGEPNGQARLTLTAYN